MDFLRDPIWQFIGVLIAIVALVVPYVQARRRRNKVNNSLRTKPSVSNPQIVEAISSRRYEKHKARKSDDILIANISSDFLNQFPTSIEVLSKHLDMVYTPENFGASNWLDVFRRFTKEEYFTTINKISLKRMSYDTQVNPGPKLYPHLEDTKRIRMRIMGLDKEVSNDD